MEGAAQPKIDASLNIDNVRSVIGVAYKHILWMPKMQEIWNWWENKNSYRQIFTTAYHVTENLRLIA